MNLWNYLRAEAPGSRRNPPRTTAPLPQTPPGGAPASVTLASIYGSPYDLPEDELLAKQDTLDFDYPCPVLQLDPVAAVHALRDVDGRTVAEAMRRPGNPEVFRRYLEAARRGVWLGYLVQGTFSHNHEPTLLDGYHRLAALARARVRVGWVVDVTAAGLY